MASLRTSIEGLVDLARGSGAVAARRVRRQKPEELVSMLRRELPKRGFKDAAEAFLFFDDNTNEVPSHPPRLGTDESLNLRCA